MPKTADRVAILIDAENADPKQFDTVMKHAAPLGRSVIKRAYGSPASLSKWERTIADHHIVPMPTPPSAKRANASDFALTIDAVGLVHDGRYDHLCIVSSDADFTLLAMHVREQGKRVTVFGEKKTRARLRSVGDGFVELADAGVAATPVARPPAAPTKKKAPAVPRAAKSAIDQDKLRSIYDEASAHAKDGVTVQEFGKLLSQHRVHYRGKLTKYLRESGLFSIKDNRVTRA